MDARGRSGPDADVLELTLVVDLRNVIVHFRPEDHATDDTHKLERRLKARFPPNGLWTAASGPRWPNHCLGHGCPNWAATSVVAFADRVRKAPQTPGFVAARTRA